MQTHYFSVSMRQTMFTQRRLVSLASERCKNGYYKRVIYEHIRYKQREYRPEMRITWQRRRRQLHALAFYSPDPSPLLSLTPRLYMPALSIVYIAVYELCFSSVTAKRRRSRSICRYISALFSLNNAQDALCTFNTIVLRQSRLLKVQRLRFESCTILHKRCRQRATSCAALRAYFGVKVD